MANEKNLKPVRTKSEARERGKKGGLASGKKRREKKTVSELVQIALDSSVSENGKKQIQKVMPDLDEADMNVKALMIAGQAYSAAGGNTKAFNALMDIQRQEEEAEKLRQQAKEHKTYHMDLDQIADVFHPVIRDIRNRWHQEFTLKGGRGSTKSSCFAMVIPELIKNNQEIHALVCRKVGNTLKDSVYAKIKWAINEQGLREEFRFSKNPLEITYKPTGQKIYFRGADDPDKIKSITPEFGYIAVLWFEELDAFAGMEEIRKIEQSAIRGGEKAWIFESFNPPKTAQNWANQYMLEPKENRLINHSTYLDVPKTWVGQPFIDEAMHLKELNPDAYEHEYMGKANGTGGQVFENVEFREITEEEINTFDTIYQGVDWGWYPDPYSFGRFYYDSAHETVYVLDEHYVNKQSNDATAQWIIDRDYDDYRITCDSAEKKSVADYRDFGLPARAAVKGPGSVEYSMKWFQRRKIVIDPNRTPNAAKEISQYEYEKDKDGNFITGYPDANNHFIDCMRYALEPVWGRRGASA